MLIAALRHILTTITTGARYLYRGREGANYKAPSPFGWWPAAAPAALLFYCHHLYECLGKEQWRLCSPQEQLSSRSAAAGELTPAPGAGLFTAPPLPSGAASGTRSHALTQGEIS